MDINDAVVSQGIVLASLLAGFAVAVASQLLVTETADDVAQTIASFLLISGFCSLTAVTVGILFFANAGDGNDQFNLGVGFLLCLGTGAFIFVIAMLRMYAKYITIPKLRWELVLAIVLLLSVILAGVTTTTD